MSIGDTPPVNQDVDRAGQGQSDSGAGVPPLRAMHRALRSVRAALLDYPRLQATATQVWARIPPKRRRWILVGVILGILVLFFATRQTPAPQRPEPGTTIFHIDSHPALIFAHSNGRVHLSAGPDGQVSIKENRSGITDAIHTHYAQRGNSIAVTVNIDDGLPLDTWVDFDVRVPRQTGANITVAAGTLEAAGLTGDLALSDTNGAIWATNLSGSIALRTQSGSINTTHVSGQLSAITQNGTITTEDTHLSGQSRVQAESGTINFHGSLDRAGSNAFMGGNGAIGIPLPRSSSFHVDARTVSGSINSDFPGVKAIQEHGGSGASGNIGTAPRARLTIQTAGGSIDLHQGI